MPYASKQGRTKIDSRSPSASGQCDRCGFLYNHSHLRWQLDYSGSGLYNKRILVCENCYDTPQQQLKVIVIPPDPMPVLNARPPDYVDAETNYRVTSGQNTVDPVTGIPIIQGNTRAAYTTILYPFAISLENNSGLIYLEGDPETFLGIENTPELYLRVTQQTGEPPGGLDQTPGTNFQVPGNDDPGLPYENVVVPQTGPIT
jgi:hypothetical protein